MIATTNLINENQPQAQNVKTVACIVSHSTRQLNTAAVAYVGFAQHFSHRWLPFLLSASMASLYVDC